MLKPIEFIVIPSKVERSSVPLFCPVCDFVMRTREDRMAFESKGCCERCALRFADPRLDEWAGGWRPSQESIEEEKLRRRSTPMSTDLTSLIEDDEGLVKE